MGKTNKSIFSPARIGELKLLQNALYCYFNAYGEYLAALKKDPPNDILGISFSRRFFPYAHDFYPEFVAVAEGIKPVMRTYWLSEKRYALLEKFCEKKGFSCVKSTFNNEDMLLARKDDAGFPMETGKKERYAYVSNSPTAAKEASELDHPESGDIIGLSRLMGYPRCCVKKWYEASKKGFSTEFIEKRNYRLTKRPHLLLNNLHQHTPFHFISHTPCSFSCKKSRKYAEELLGAMAKKHSFFLKIAPMLLSFPLLRLARRGETILFIGNPSKTSLDYVCCYPFPDGDATHFLDGDRMEIGKKEIDVFWKGSKLRSIRMKGTYEKPLIYTFR